jgi:hypothetical protein
VIALNIIVGRYPLVQLQERANLTNTGQYITPITKCANMTLIIQI